MSSGGTSLNTSAPVAAPIAAPGAYVVGYGKPPKATQWKKGVSGNPAGKKPGAKNFKALFNQVAMKQEPVTQPNGKRVKKTLLELFISSVFAHAQNGKKSMTPVAAKLMESQFYEPAEKPPVLNKIMKCPDGVYLDYFISDDVAAWIDKIASEPAFPKSLENADEGAVVSDEASGE